MIGHLIQCFLSDLEPNKASIMEGNYARPGSFTNPYDLVPRMPRVSHDLKARVRQSWNDSRLALRFWLTHGTWRDEVLPICEGPGHLGPA
jgi:hypothetical protein